MGVMKLLVICSFSVCALVCCLWCLLHAASCPLDSLHISWRWTANLQAYFTSPLLFLLLNLVMGALFFINSVKSNNKTQQLGTAQHNNERKKVPSQSNSAAVASGSIPGSSSARRLPVPHNKQLARSKSEKLSTMATTTLSQRSTGSGESAGFLADQFTKKKKSRRGSSSSADQGELRPGDGETASLKKASSTPSPSPSYAVAHAGEHGGGDNEVDRRAEDFISRFYLQMRMQRLESLQRYNQRMDRSYGR